MLKITLSKKKGGHEEKGTLITICLLLKEFFV
jgi:hypothetical protein